MYLFPIIFVYFKTLVGASLPLDKRRAVFLNVLFKNFLNICKHSKWGSTIVDGGQFSSFSEFYQTTKNTVLNWSLKKCVKFGGYKLNGRVRIVPNERTRRSQGCAENYLLIYFKTINWNHNHC